MLDILHHCLGELKKNGEYTYQIRFLLKLCFYFKHFWKGNLKTTGKVLRTICKHSQGPSTRDFQFF